MSADERKPTEPTPEDQQPPPADPPTEPDDNGRPPPERPSVSRKGPVLQRQLAEFFAGASLAAMVAGDEFSANILAQQAEPLAAAWYRLAEQNPRVKAVIEKMVGGSAWGEALLVTAATVLPIAAHHKLIPPEVAGPFGFVPKSPEVRDHERRDSDGPGA